jgi:hypothetical protein
MIESRITLVLGAGASSHASYYVGPLFNAAILALAADKTYRAEVAELGYENLDGFLEQLTYGNYGTPDRLMEEHPDFEAVGKYCKAKVLTNLEDDAYLFKNGRPGWYGTLYDRLEIGSEKYNPESLSVVTFNYDRSLEHSLWRIISTNCRDDEPKAVAMWKRRPEIVHVHGILDPYEPGSETHRDYERVTDPSVLTETAAQIEIIHTANPDTDAFERARQLLDSAERVVFLGFGFDKLNFDRLRVFNAEEQRAKIEGTLMNSGTRHHRYILNDVIGSGANARKLKDVLLDRYVEEEL